MRVLSRLRSSSGPLLGRLTSSVRPSMKLYTFAFGVVILASLLGCQAPSFLVQRDMTWPQGQFGYISGTVFEPDGQTTFSHAVIILHLHDSSLVAPERVKTTGPDGSFSFGLIPLGRYVLNQARPNSGPCGRESDSAGCISFRYPEIRRSYSKVLKFKSKSVLGDRVLTKLVVTLHNGTYADPIFHP